ncbi:nucleotide sugar dehydrogenase [Candidatus Enterococcus murrayae]|uniref:Nucleotide sugar dehydrogenase n=1 Tax=Candidatus Enterococcus murrayae TaxID=2815321 RepID=A0ABS3HKQ8_9ENTE|nr:nucleotide sugar dehydrogenase [Enterococcus sp. MJM16]MBO0454024.1 nucleotide sugar dehydrogenase [Enterococcus sp. MJM16]
MKNLVQKLKKKEVALSVVGLGYVGLPVALEFAKHLKVIGFDVNKSKIEQYQHGIDVTNEVGDDCIRQSSIMFTSDEIRLSEAQFHVVAVPTPINKDKSPNLTPLKSATEIVGRNLKKGSIVVFESTVYPGLTEEICIPILEQCSGLSFGKDFKVGYSPERINPGDKGHRLKEITKLVSGSDDESLEIIAEVYEWVIKAGVFKTASIKVAEAAKIIENAQRDINIAFMNELSLIFHRMEIDTKEVLEAAKTKWNFLDFSPGLVGGHCIGVDPYYLTHRAEQYGYQSDVILAGRKINDNLGKMIAQEAVKVLIKKNKNFSDAKIGVFGITFKPNCSDTRNTKIIDIVEELKEYSLDPLVYDPEADSEEVKRDYDIELVDETEMNNLDVLILAVDHAVFQNKPFDYWLDRLTTTKIIFDVKGILDRQTMTAADVEYWRL